MRVLVVQNKVFKKKEDTLLGIDNLLCSVDYKSVDLIVFPEMFTTPYDVEYLDMYKENESGITVEFLRSLSYDTNAFVVGGTIPFYEESNTYNRCIVYQHGEEITKYDKQKLFSITYPSGERFTEETVLTKGNNFSTFKIGDITVGILICFDIRFPNLAEIYSNLGCDLIVVPAAFNTFTGPLHWKTTFRSRAIDNQLFMIGCSPSADSYGDYKTYGHSIAVDPYGVVIEEMVDDNGYMLIDLDFELIDKVRNQIPIIKNR